MAKKLLSALLVLALLVGLCGCSKSNDEQTTDITPAETAEPTEVETVSEQETTEIPQENSVSEDSQDEATLESEEIAEDIPVEPLVEEPTVLEEPVAPVTHDVESVDLESENGRLSYTGYEFANENFYLDAETYANYTNGGTVGTTIFLNFEFTNKCEKPDGVKSFFSISAYQNGTALDTPKAYRNPPEGFDNYHDGSVMKDCSQGISKAFDILDYSPITIMVEDKDDPDNYQIMTISIEASEDGIQETTEESSVAIPLTVGDTITLDFVEMTISEFAFAEDIQQSVSFGNAYGFSFTNITGPAPISGMTYVYLCGTIKNISTDELPVYDFFEGNFQIDQYNYNVTANDCNVIDGAGKPCSMIDPLTTYGFTIYASIPLELAQAYSAKSFTFGFYDLFENEELARNRAFSDDAISQCPYRYTVS